MLEAVEGPGSRPVSPPQGPRLGIIHSPWGIIPSPGQPKVGPETMWLNKMDAVLTGRSPWVLACVLNSHWAETSLLVSTHFYSITIKCQVQWVSLRKTAVEGDRKCLAIQPIFYPFLNLHFCFVMLLAVISSFPSFLLCACPLDLIIRCWTTIYSP